MRLPEYISKIGVEKFTKMLRDCDVKKRTVISWQRMERRPRPEIAQVIVERTPVTMEGIYG
jgi:hypothetical protein